jgi:hypothetical protein
MSDRRTRRAATLLVIGIALAGCGANLTGQADSSVLAGSAPYGKNDLGTLTYRAVDLILAAASGVSVDSPLIVASVADTQNLESSSALGNIVADMIRTRIVQDGYAASEFRLRSAIGFNKGQGEFLLSRNRRALLAAPNAAAIVTGTYAVSFEKVYVSLKLISATDAHIMAGADFVVPLKDVSGLLPRANT